MKKFSNYYVCECGKSRKFGEVHSCELLDENFVVYLNQSMQKFYLTTAPPFNKRIKYFLLRIKNAVARTFQ